jgi:hypothetical protein
MNKKYYRKYIQKLINSNPTSIIITRKTIINDGFGGKIVTDVELDPQTVRIYNKKAQREIISDKGTTTAYYASSTLKMLALSGANLEEGDMFEYAGKLLKIAYIGDYEGICKQVELEVII